MTRPFSGDLGQRAIAAVEGGMTWRSAAERFGVAVSTAIEWVRRWRQTGSTGPRPRGGGKRSHRIGVHAPEILALVEARPGLTLLETAAHLEQAHELRVAQSTVWRFFRRHGITVKTAAHASEQPRPDIARRCQVWFEQQPDLDPERPVFIDATGASTKMAGAMATRSEASAAVPPSHMATGRPRPSSARSGSGA